MAGVEHVSPGSILVFAGLCGCISGAVGAMGQREHSRFRREGVRRVPRGGQGAGGVSGWAGLEGRSQQGYWCLAEGHGCMGRAEAGAMGVLCKKTPQQAVCKTRL